MGLKVGCYFGNSGKIEIMGLNEDGDLNVEKIIETGDADPERRSFYCSGENWTKSIHLGKEMGWIGKGTINYYDSKEETDPEILDYEPGYGDENGLKIFDADDANAFANALEKALQLMNEFQLAEYGGQNTLLILQAMTEAEYNQINRNLSFEYLTEFISFLRKGMFYYEFDDF